MRRLWLLRHFGVGATNARCCWVSKPDVTDVSTDTSKASLEAPVAQTLEDAVVSYLTKGSDEFVPWLKDGNVFATLHKHQPQLNDMQRYVDQARRSRKSGAVPPHLNGVNRSRHAPYTAPPLCGGVPFHMSPAVRRDVHRHVRERENEQITAHTRSCDPRRTALLCSSGTDGSGKTTMLHHTTVEAVRVLEAMVAECVEGDARHLYRPLGFVVTFGNATITESHERMKPSSLYPFLTGIALRMAHSVLNHVQHTIYKSSTESYEQFTSTILKHCDFGNDLHNFKCIIAALRTVLHWKGPMFIAIDDFNVVCSDAQSRLCRNDNDTIPYQSRLVADVLESICFRLLDNALPVISGKKHALYERYIAVSVLKVLDIAALSATTRPLIYQPVTMMSVKEAAWHLTTIKSKEYSVHMHESFARMFVGKRKPSSNLRFHQIIFLVHVALCTFTPWQLSECMSQPQIRDFSRGYFVKTFWKAADHLVLPAKVATLSACLCAAQLVAGATEVDIFDLHSAEHRAFALAPGLADSCIVTDALTPGLSEKDFRQHPRRATRVIVSPKFLNSLHLSWPKDAHSSTVIYVIALTSRLVRHTAIATALVQAGSKLIAYGGAPRRNKRREHICGQLIDKWKYSTTDAFEQLTFRALCLHISSVLETGETTVDDILRKVCLPLGNEKNRVDATVELGPLETIAVRNFPSFFADVFSLSDSQRPYDSIYSSVLDALGTLEKDGDLRGNVLQLTTNSPNPVAMHVGDTSYENVQRALAKGNHFCFQPRNPHNDGEDGVVFLRNAGAERTWTVLVVQSLRGRRESAGQLPAAIVDRSGTVHTLRYVRILVTTSLVEERHVAEAWSGEKALEDAKVRTLACANAAFVKFGLEKFDSVNAAAAGWVDNERRMDPLSKGHLQADNRAAWLLRHLNVEGQQCSSDVVACGPVIAECRMDLDKIMEWCPTVGVFVSNLLTIRNFVETR